MPPHRASSCGVSRDLVAGQPHPGAVQRDFACARESLQHCEKGLGRKPRLELQPQALQPDPR